MEEKSNKHDAEEILAVHNALVKAFDTLDDTDVINHRPTLRVLSQDIADLADRTQTLFEQYQKEAKLGRTS